MFLQRPVTECFDFEVLEERHQTKKSKERYSTAVSA